MEKGHIISPFGFFGGKAKMAPLICELIDYSTSIYIEPFGGAARTLLNKKSKHEIEIYNDSSLGLCAFMNLMSRWDTASELINRIYDTEYSREAFRVALDYRGIFDNTVKNQLQRDFKSILIVLFRRYGLINEWEGYQAVERILRAKDDTAQSVFKNLWAMCTTIERESLTQSLNNLLETKQDTQFLDFDLPDNWGGVDTSDYLNDYDLAVATYVLYAQGRDGMGKYWSSKRFKTQDAYYKYMDSLYDVAERLEGVNVPGAEDAMTFVQYSEYLNNTDTMFYLDPSYLREDDNAYKDLGKSTYKDSFSEQQHEQLLLAIRDAKSKILISNYDVPLYNEHLTRERGWKRYEYETKTGLGREGQRDRLEVLWYNY